MGSTGFSLWFLSPVIMHLESWRAGAFPVGWGAAWTQQTSTFTRLAKTKTIYQTERPGFQEAGEPAHLGTRRTCNPTKKRSQLGNQLIYQSINLCSEQIRRNTFTKNLSPGRYSFCWTCVCVNAQLHLMVRTLFFFRKLLCGGSVNLMEAHMWIIDGNVLYNERRAGDGRGKVGQANTDK